jgi:transcriptional regulator with XRE-family HTH domain
VIQQNDVYARAYFYLGNLYSWRAYYEEDEGKERIFQAHARDMYTQTAQKSTLRPQESDALSHFGLGLVHYRQYMKTKKQNRNPDIQLLKHAHQAFTTAWEKDKSFYFVRTARALVYKQRTELLKEQKEQKQREQHINHAIQEFQYAKAIAADLKDTESLKWIDRQILELKFKKRGMGEPEWQVAVQ